jgi:hypothetical protein
VRVFFALFGGAKKELAPFVSKHVAYAAEENSERFVVLDEQVQPAYDNIFDLVFSSDSQHLGYAVELGKSQFVVVDGKESSRYTSVFPDGIIFDSNSHFRYLARRDSGIFMVEETIE